MARRCQNECITPHACGEQSVARLKDLEGEARHTSLFTRQPLVVRKR